MMAEDWIKMRLNLHEDAAVIAMATELNMDEFSIVGRLHRLWSWADQQTEDGSVRNLSATFVDRFVNCSGFFSAMARVGWISEIENGFSFPNFDTHNGENAKKRAKENRRKSAARKEKTVSATCPKNVRKKTDTCPQNVQEKRDQRREEERREEYTSPPPTSSGGVVGSKEAEEGKPVLDSGEEPTGWKAIHIELKKLGMAEAGEAIERCMTQGLTPEDVAAVIAYWRSKPADYWPKPVAALWSKLTRIIEGEEIDSAWLQPSDRYVQQYLNAKASSQRQEAYQLEKRDKAPAKPKRDLEALERSYGPRLDSMPTNEREEFFVANAADNFQLSLWRRSWKKPGGTRNQILDYLANLKVPIADDAPS